MAEATVNQTSGFIDPDLIWKDIFTDPQWMFKTGMGGIVNASCLVLAGGQFHFFARGFGDNSPCLWLLAAGDSHQGSQS